jgi:hypothetical protein
MLIKIDSEKLGELIENILLNYEIHDLYEDEDRDMNIGLVDMLCAENENDISKGKERIHYIVDAIISDLLDYQENKEKP